MAKKRKKYLTNAENSVVLWCNKKHTTQGVNNEHNILQIR